MTDRAPDPDGTRCAIGRGLELASLVASVAVVVWLCLAVRPGNWIVVVLVAVAFLVGAAGVAAELVAATTRGRHRNQGLHESPTDRARCHNEPDDAGLDPTTGQMTTAVVLGEEPEELQVGAVALARGRGPCVVLAPGTVEVPEQIESLDVTVIRGESLAAALRTAMDEIDTEWVLLSSGRSVPVLDGDDLERLTDGAGDWVSGRTELVASGPWVHDTVAACSIRLRDVSAEAGLALWEPNATLVRSSALRDFPMQPGEPRGAWLRSHDALSGPDRRESTVSVVGVPSSTASIWTEATAVRSGFVADLTNAARGSAGHRRLIAWLLLARELPVLTMPAWLAVVLASAASGDLPVRTYGGLLPLALLTVILARWAGLRLALGVELRPKADLLTMGSRVPSTYLAARSAITGRTRRPKEVLHPHLLLWIAAIAALVVVSLIVADPPGAGVSPGVVAAAIVTLAVLWLAAVKLLARRDWYRSSLRLPVELPATVDGESCSTIDISPAGISVLVEPTNTLKVGDRVPAQVDVPGATIDATVTIARRARTRDRLLLGMTIDVAPGDRSRWLTYQLTVARERSSTEWASGAQTPRPRPRSGRVELIALITAVVLAGVLLVGVGAAMAGVDVSVVRSSSMEPTIAKGSIAASQEVAVDRLAPGDVVTIEPDDGDLPVTHRVVGITNSDGVMVVETRGDANTTSEYWDLGPASEVQRVIVSVPRVGTVIGWARSNIAMVVVGVVVVALAVLARSQAVRDRRRGGAPDGPHEGEPDEVVRPDAGSRA